MEFHCQKHFGTGSLAVIQVLVHMVNRFHTSCTK